MFDYTKFKELNHNIGIARNILGKRLEELRVLVREIPPELIASRTGAAIVEQSAHWKAIRVMLFSDIVEVSCPDFIAYGVGNKILPDMIQGMILYHFMTSDGTMETGRWISFADLPDGRTYAKAYQGYTGILLVKEFGMDVHRFGRACTQAGGTPSQHGDGAYLFSALPRVPLLVTYHIGDDEFPSSCQILFDSSASHHLPIDACAILASILTQKILKQVGSLKKEG